MIENLKPKDFASDQDIRWCPGCGDFAILKQMQNILPKIGVPREKIVFISGIGCSSRFPYYMNTYGMHSIHGRATAIASGLRAMRKDLSIWIVTGDGDALSIGGNHLIHLLRRDFDVNILLFNNEIYGLTKGQYSPTSKNKIVTKSSPYGSDSEPFNPLALALGAGATFVARTADREAKHLQEMLLRAHQHRGTSLVEIYQNCHIFNDGAFKKFTDRESKKATTITLEHGKPIVFGEKEKKGFVFDDLKPVVVPYDENSDAQYWMHDEEDSVKAHFLSRFFGENSPRPFGVFYKKMNDISPDIGRGQKRSKALKNLIEGAHSWTIQ